MDFNQENVDFLKNNFKIYNKLCDKAKEVLFVLINISEGKTNFFEVANFDEELLELSPIEQILCVSFEFFDFLEIENFRISYFSQSIINLNENPYKVDFLIDSFIDFSKDVAEEIMLKRKIVIECDGYEYHSSKKQVNYDYQRENNLKIAGYDVIRFTGSQIYTNPLQCVRDIYKYVKSTNKEYFECNKQITTQ